MASGSRLGYGTRALCLAALAALPGLITALVLLWLWHAPAVLRWSLAAALVGSTLLLLRPLAAAAVRPLETMTNLVAAQRDGDFSMRFHSSGRPGDALDGLAREVNALSSTLREQRIGAAEAAALLRR